MLSTMSRALVDNYRTNLELKVLGTSETSYRKALADLRGFTCEQVEFCKRNSMPWQEVS